MKFFKTVKVIKSREGVIHFKRFAIFESQLFSIYIHRIYKADEDDHLHSHPWPFIGVILKGSYVETYKLPNEQTFPKDFISGERKDGTKFFWGLRTLKPGTISKSDTKRYHKIFMLNTPKVVTLALAGRKKNSWGYDLNGEHVDSELYRTRKNVIKNRKNNL